MAINDAATLVIGSGNYFTSTAGTAKPADLSTIAGTWENIGHTSLDEVMGVSSEGGDQTVLGTLQKRQLRTSRTTQTDSFSLLVQQFDEATLRLYYGSNSTVGPDGSVRKPGAASPTQKAFLAVFWDGLNVFTIYAPLAEISRGDDVDFADTENLAGLPLSITPLNYSTNVWPYEVSPVRLWAAAWVATTVYALGAYCTLPGGQVLQVTTAGTSGATAPTAPAVGATVTDATVTWTRIS